MKKSLLALILICALMLCSVCMAEEARPRLDTADRIVYQITNGKYRILNLQGNFVSEDYDAFPSDQIGECAIYMANGRYGYVAKDGTVLIQPNYLSLPEFDEGYAIVEIEDIDATNVDGFSGGFMFPRCSGVIDVYGDIVLPIEYVSVTFSGDVSYAKVITQKGEKSQYGLFDLEQKKMTIEPQDYFFNDDPHGGTLVVGQMVENTDDNADSYSNAEAYLYGIISVEGDALAPLDYDRIDYDSTFRGYICYNDDKVVKVYETENGTLVEKAK